MNRLIERESLFMCVGLLALAAASHAAFSIPPGTVLPVLLNSTISSTKSKPGQIITARIMQDVPLPDGSKIAAGATVLGHVVDVTPASNGRGASISLQFDTLNISRGKFPIVTNLRAIASFMEVEQAQIPPSGPDRGTSSYSWTTVQIGGDTVYRGGGPVKEGSAVVGQPAYGGVLARMSPNPDRGCRGAIGENDAPQALWVFSSGACGAYSLSNVEIVHAGRTAPIGRIILQSRKGELKIGGGSGLLLRVIAPDAGGI